MTTRPRTLAGLLALVLVSATALTPDVHADEPWILDANNWQEGEKLLPDPVLKRLKAGEYWFKVVPVDPARFAQNYSKAFRDATTANAGKYDLEPKQCGLVTKGTNELPEFVFGMPFPDVDKNDPQAGCKIAHNFNFAGLQGGGGGATFTLNGVDTSGQFRRIKAFIHSMGYQGRHGARSSTTPRDSRGRPWAPPSSPSTSRASRRSPSATGTGRARTRSGRTFPRPAARGA
jgi:hypothetical protein